MIVIIPCWRRPAHLAALLRTIERARLADQQRYIFTVDRGEAPEIDDVISSFALGRQIAGIFYQGDHGNSGPAYNILHGWRLGLALSRAARSEATVSAANELIGLLEEDLLVADDIFEFWEDVMQLPMHVGVSACRNQNLKDGWFDVVSRAAQAAPALEAVYPDRSYQSLAVALRPYFIEEVLRHASPAYFADPARYVEKRLYDAELPASACSQDALFHRVIRRDDLRMLYPIVPRACHVGWYGYNRRHGRAIEGYRGCGFADRRMEQAWREVSERILAMTSDDMNALADPKFRDIERCGLVHSQRASLRLV